MQQPLDSVDMWEGDAREREGRGRHSVEDEHSNKKEDEHSNKKGDERGRK